MTLVVDASVALKWFVDESGTAEALRLLDGAELLIAPELIVAELCNAAWKAVRAGDMVAEQQDRVARDLVQVLDELVPLAPLGARAAALSRLLDHPAYDCFYLALAERREARLVTADRRLLGRVSGTEWSTLVASLAGV